MSDYRWWEVALIDEFDQTHTFRVFSNSRSNAIVRGFDAAIEHGYRTANDWSLHWVEQASRLR